jgi:hypothetical protein
MRTAQRLVAMSLPMGLLGLTLLAQENNGKPEITPDVKHDVSPPMRQLPVPPRSDVPRERPLRTVPQGPALNQPDPVLQIASGPQVLTTSGLSFAGVGNGDYGFAPDAAPPDTEGAVGATQYVQWVNESFAVFNKSGGIVFGPTPGNTLWSGFGGGCETNNDGDPIVQYDKLANRWVFTQFSVSTTPYLQCVAVSTTSDATGTYNRYAFSYGTTQFPDYPKLGVWPDAYYISFNIFNHGVSFAGSKVCAYDRAKMLAGSAATQQCFQLSSSFGGLLPSDQDGPASPPPAGTPNFFLNFGSNKLNLWKFHVDFVTPANTTLSGPTSVPVAAFSAACNGGTCIPQLGTTQQLDSLADRLMYRLAYRHFSDHDTLVVNHSVATGSGNVGVRWYELRNPAGTPVVFQQGTFAPDSSYRWMGSAAMDQSGNIALGYSISSSSMHPAIGFTGRVPTDTLGTMQTENVILSGGGSQMGNNLSRWGDYSAMTVDPVDDCTFWYTNEYLKANGSFNWSTWIYSFKLTGCGSAASPDYSISATPASQTVTQGGVTSYTINVSGSGGYAGTVNLSVSGLPANATFSFNPTSVTGSGSSTLTVNSVTAAAGNYPLTITGTDGTLVRTTSVTLIINAPAAGDFSISASPGTVVTRQNSAASFTVTVTPSGGFNSGVTLNISGLPAGAGASFNPASVIGSGTSSLAVNTGSAAAGTYTLTITGASGSTSHSTNVTLKIH